MKPNLLLIIVLSLLLSSCVTERRCNQKYPVQSTDSVYIHTNSIIRDTIINYSIQSDTIRAVTPSKFSYLSNKYSYTTARVDSGLLYHELFTIKQDIPIRIDSVIRYQTVTKYHDRTVTVPKRYVPFIVKLLAWVGGISILYVAIRLLLK